MEGIIRGTKKPPRMLVYGPPKIGKSSFGAASDNPLFVTTEDGVDSIPVDQLPRSETWEEFLSNIKKVMTTNHEYKTLVVDTINGAADLCAAYVCRTTFGGNWSPKNGFASFGQGYAAAAIEFKKLLPLLDSCREKGMTVLLLAHTGIQTVKNPIDGDYNKYSPDIDKRMWSVLSAWLDIILRAEYEHSIIESDGRKKAITTTERVLVARGSLAQDAGTRCGFELPEVLPLSWDAVAAWVLPKELDPRAKEFFELFHTLNAEQQAGALEFLGIPSIGELSRANKQKIDTALRRIKKGV
jgi:hypothetical protein